MIAANDFDNTIKNSGQNVTINALGGNDSIFNTGSEVSIDGGDGNDRISVNGGEKSIIEGGKANDTIENDNVNNILISGGEGDDNIRNTGASVSIDGGEGNDDIVNMNGENVLFNYKSGDGNDVINGFRADSTLSISGGLHFTETSGKDIIVTVGKGKITLDGAASLSTVNIINAKYAIFTVKDSKVIAAIPQSVKGDAYQFNAELNLLTLKDDLKKYSVVIRNEDNSSVKVNWHYGTAELSRNSTLEYQLDGSKNNVTLTSKTYGDKITFKEDALFTYGEISVDLLKGSVLSTKGAKEISFDNNSSANITAPEGAKFEIDTSKLTVNNLPITSVNGAGTISMEKDGLSFEGYGAQFADLEVAKEGYFGKLAPMTVNYNSAEKLYTIYNTTCVKTLSSDFTKLQFDFADDTKKQSATDEKYAYYKVNDVAIQLAKNDDNVGVLEVKGSTFKVQDKEIDTSKIGRITIDEQLTFSGTEIDFDGVKVNYALNKPVSYSLDGKEITISDAATLTTGDDTKTFKCEAGSYVVNGKSFETSTDLTFTADANQI